jgi:hypothetical protein
VVILEFVFYLRGSCYCDTLIAFHVMRIKYMSRVNVISKLQLLKID